MGLWDRLLRLTNPESYEPAQIVQRDQYEPFLATGGIPVADPATPLEEFILTGCDSRVHRLWKSQPNLRKVVDFIARNVASVPLGAYERVSDTERRRLHDEPLANALRSPKRGVAPYRLWHGVISDRLIYDRWAVLHGQDEEGRLTLTRLPASRTWIRTDSIGAVQGVHWWNGKGWSDPIPLDTLIFDHGYAATSAGLSPVETLRGILEESAEAERYRRDLWENGTRAPGYIHRPAESKWEENQRNRFVESLRAQFGRGGTRPGGLPLLEDGMEIRRLDIFSPRDMKDIEARQLSAVEVASAYHVAPELVGAREGNFSNVDAFRQMLWSVSLGPYIDEWQGAINAQLVPLLAAGRDVYVEANVDAKMRGSFLEQTRVMQSAVGAPWLTRNEARAMQNRSPVEGGDKLITPLNVLIGGQASPNDSGTQNETDG